MSMNARDITPVLINASILGVLISAVVSRGIDSQKTRDRALMSTSAKSSKTNRSPTVTTYVSAHVKTLRALSGAPVLMAIIWTKTTGLALVCQSLNRNPILKYCFIDINECDFQCKGEDQICLNTRGGFKCNRVVCPNGYERDRNHKRFQNKS